MQSDYLKKIVPIHAFSSHERHPSLCTINAHEERKNFSSNLSSYSSLLPTQEQQHQSLLPPQSTLSDSSSSTKQLPSLSSTVTSSHSPILLSPFTESKIKTLGIKEEAIPMDGKETVSHLSAVQSNQTLVDESSSTNHEHHHMNDRNKNYVSKSLDISSKSCVNLVLSSTTIHPTKNDEGSIIEPQLDNPLMNQQESSSSLDSTLMLRRDSLSTSDQDLHTLIKNSFQKKKRNLNMTLSYSELNSLKEMDPIAYKRYRNTQAARKSRAKKLEKMIDLECKVQVLEEANQKLIIKTSVLEHEKSLWEEKQVQYKERIMKLECQLNDTCKAFIKIADSKLVS